MEKKDVGRLNRKSWAKSDCSPPSPCFRAGERVVPLAAQICFWLSRKHGEAGLRRGWSGQEEGHSPAAEVGVQNAALLRRGTFCPPGGQGTRVWRSLSSSTLLSLRWNSQLARGSLAWELGDVSIL